MTTDEILNSLNTAQRKELEEKLHVASASVASDFYKDPKKFATITTVVELKERVVLEVKISLHQGDKDKVHPVIEEITQK